MQIGGDIILALVGPHYGKTITLGRFRGQERNAAGGYHFVDGKIAVPYDRMQSTGKNLMMCYQCVPVEQAEEAQAVWEEQHGVRRVQSGSEGPDGSVQPTGGGHSPGPAAQQQSDAAAAAAGAQPQAGGGDGLGPEGGDQSIVAALGRLDVNDDEHWTANGLPRLDVLTTLSGVRVTRPDIERLHPNFTRASARIA